MMKCRLILVNWIAKVIQEADIEPQEIAHVRPPLSPLTTRNSSFQCTTNLLSLIIFVSCLQQVIFIIFPIIINDRIKGITPANIPLSIYVQDMCHAVLHEKISLHVVITIKIYSLLLFWWRDKTEPVTTTTKKQKYFGRFYKSRNHK